jgi:phosphate transport system substrate-binding protein
MSLTGQSRKGWILSVTFSAAITLIAGMVAVSTSTAAEHGLRVKGSVLLAAGVDELAKEFVKQHPGAVVVVSGGGTIKGFEDFIAKNVELVMATREMTSDEEKAASQKGIAPIKRIIAWGCITIIVNPENPVNELTLDQVKGIFTGATTSWKQVGGPDTPIDVLLPDPTKHGTNRFFQTTLMNDAPYAANAKFKPDYTRIVRDVAQDKAAVALCVLSKAEGAGNQVKMLAIQKDSGSPAVAPSAKTASDRSYPLSRPLYFYWDGKAEAPQRKDFVDFCEKTGVRLR